MRYNFFRPLIDNKEKLTKLFKRIGIKCNLLSKTKLEYLDGFDRFKGYKGETNYDFYTGNNIEEIYCEIKYTEKFEKCKNDIK